MDKTNKTEFKILGISIWKICAYFIIYSFFGYVIETLFAIITMGTWECRQSFLYGPFLGIYGVGAVLIILFAQYFDKNNFRLFLGGYIIGTITEYIVSFGTEVIVGTRWWDYSDKILNINGRVCLLYSIFWGILTVFLVRKVNPRIDKICNKIQEKISKKILKIIISILIVFLAFDCIATVFAQEYFIDSMVIRNGVQVEKQEEVQERYNKIRENQSISNFVDTFWNDEKMIKTFPNIKIKDKDGNIIWLRELLPSIKPYYWRR